MADQLSPAEERVARELLREPRANKLIAHDLGITIHTVRTHMERIYKKLGVENRGQAIKALMTAGMVLCLCISAHAQSRLFPSGPVVPTGSPAAVNVNFAGGGLAVTALQVTYTVPPGAILTAGSAITAGVTLATSVVGGQAVIIAYSPTNATIPDGVLVTISFTSAGAFTFAPSNYLAVNALAQLTSLTAAALTWANPCDVTGDGSVDAADISAIVAQINGTAICKGDANKDGVCTVQDLMMIQRVIAGGQCKVGP